MFVHTERLGGLTGPRVLLLGVGGALLLGAGWGWISLHETAVAAPTAVAGQVIDPPAAPVVLVFVSGAVSHPGLYRLSPAARIADALAAAGGMTASADPGHLPDLAGLVHDGRQINVPFLKSTSAVARIDINSAAADELAAIPGMPAGLPQEIVQYRDDWGQFSSLSQLRTEFGVDSATVTALGKYLRVVVTPAP